MKVFSKKEDSTLTLIKKEIQSYLNDTFFSKIEMIRIGNNPVEDDNDVF